MLNLELLRQIPDPGQWDTYATWFETLATGTSRIPGDAVLLSVSGAEVATASGIYGRFGSENFRRFLGAILAADWLTYEVASDRVDLPRLVFVLDRFPDGFRAWFARADDDSWLPIGYSAWYPIDHATYGRFVNNDPPWRDRAVVPIKSQTHGDYAYLFNYSVLPQFRRGAGSRGLLESLRTDLTKLRSRGLVAITVSDDGARVARRFGLTRRHEIEVDAAREEIWVSGG